MSRSTARRAGISTLAALTLGATLFGGVAHAADPVVNSDGTTTTTVAPVVINTNANVKFVSASANFTGGYAKAYQTNAPGHFGQLDFGFTIVPNVPAGGRIEVVITDKLSYQVLQTVTILPGDSKTVSYSDVTDGLSQKDPVRADVFSYGATGVKKNLGVASTTGYWGWADQSRVLSDITTVLSPATDANGNAFYRTFTWGDSVPAPALQNLTGFVDNGVLTISYSQYENGVLVNKGVLSRQTVSVQPGHQTWFPSTTPLPANAKGELTVTYVSNGFAAEPYTVPFSTFVKTSSGDSDADDKD